MAGTGKITRLSKYKACLLGGVLGDCIGAVFEGMEDVSMSDVNKHIRKVERLMKTSTEKLPYTDDTAMARKVAQSLIKCRKADQKHLAKAFTEEYFEQPKRGYGGNIANVFCDLKDENYKDPTGPASRQFEGSGSYGNGSAMRIGPAALFGEKLPETNFYKLITDVSTITHTHKDAVNGAILLAVAVQMALELNPCEELDHTEYLSKLKKCINALEEPHTVSGETEKQSQEKATYSNKLDNISELLNKPENVVDEVIDKLGTWVAAVDSVPAAIFCFLRTNKYPEEVERNSGIERTIMYAMTLGGDTDTIACMAGYVAGAYYGVDQISKSWLHACEASEEMEQYAETIYKMNYAAETEMSNT